MDFSKIISYKPCSASFSSQQIARGGMEVCRKKRDAPTLSFNRIFKSLSQCEDSSRLISHYNDIVIYE